MAFDYCTLPADDERSIRPFELAPVGSRRFTISSGDFTLEGIITLSRGCVVSAPLPGLSPCCSGSPLSHGEGTFLSRLVRRRAYRQPSAFSWRSDMTTARIQKPFADSRNLHCPGLAERGPDSDLAGGGVEESGPSAVPLEILGHDLHTKEPQGRPGFHDILLSDVGDCYV